MNFREIGRQRGRAAAHTMRSGLQRLMESEFDMYRQLFPTLGEGYDMAAGVIAYDQQALQCEPPLSKFPETKGLVERALGEREGFLDGSGFTQAHAAYYYSWRAFMWKHVNAHHVARYDLFHMPQQCTNIFFPDGRDGITVGDNRDDIPYPWQTGITDFRLGKVPRDSRPYWRQGSVSSLVLLDDEPECIFPYDPYEFMPPECLDNIADIVAYMDQRRDFWGPANQIWTDDHGNAIAVEKANVRAAYRSPEVNGAVCVTACSYLNPELNNFKRERFEEAARRKGEGVEDSLDLAYSDGCDARHRRLWELTNAEASRPGGATLWGTFEIISDTAVPFPERICLSGEKTAPREPQGNWTLKQHATVLTGPHRRSLYRSIQDLANPRSIVEEMPRLVLGEDVELLPQWQQDIDAGKCVLVQ